MRTFLDFEKPIAELEGKIEELRHLSSSNDINIADEVARLQKKLETLLSQTYRKLTPWQKTQVARHVDRPHALAYIRELFTDFVPLGGDRRFGEDLAMIGGLARFGDTPILVIGQEKGHDTETRIRHNFGMPRPEGYRKAERLMRLADRFRLPVISLIDTPGAYPGVDAEARGQAEAIARCIETCLTLSVPLISVIIGEGGSGGAIALAAGDRVLMLEHAIYSVISPEGCASILWRDSEQAPAAAQALRLTAGDLQGFAIIDEIIPEPLGGAHRDPVRTIANTGDAIARALATLSEGTGPERRDQRRRRFLAIGTVA